jgi:galactonate dehydratase
VKITQLETVRLGEFPNIIWVRLHTDEGLTGLGETFMGAEAVEAYLHEWVAGRIVGKDPLAIEARNKDITGYLGWRGSGVETRGNSAVDIALWDLFGKARQYAGRTPRWAARAGTSIRIYNTCAGYQYIREQQEPDQSPTGAWAGPLRAVRRPRRLSAPRRRTGAVAARAGHHGHEDLAVRRSAAERSGGQYISNADLDGRRCRTFREDPQARSATRWTSWWSSTRCGSYPMAQEDRPCAEAEYDTYWHEDPIRMDSLGAQATTRRTATRVVCASETLATRMALPRPTWRRACRRRGDARPVVVRRAVRGAQDRRHGRGLALPVAPHDCTGPVVLGMASTPSLAARAATR